MTEGAWLTCDDPLSMWEYLRGKGTDRKCRLLAVASIRRVAVWFANDAKVHELLLGAAEVGEQYVDGTLPTAEFKRLCDRFHFYTRLGALSDAQRFAGEAVTLLLADAPHAAAYGITFAADAVTELTEDLPPRTPPPRESELAAQAALVRDVFGSPFRPVPFNPSWRTEVAVSLARGMWESRDFSRMPLLADALQAAGCEDEQILRHCSSPATHVRGCWVVDLTLGLG